MEMPRHAQPKPATEATRREPLSVLGSATPPSVDTWGRTRAETLDGSSPPMNQ
jgi:hypothetical protein